MTVAGPGAEYVLVEAGQQPHGGEGDIDASSSRSSTRTYAGSPLTSTWTNRSSSALNQVRSCRLPNQPPASQLPKASTVVGPYERKYATIAAAAAASRTGESPPAQSRVLQSHEGNAAPLARSEAQVTLPGKRLQKRAPTRAEPFRDVTQPTLGADRGDEAPA